MEALGNPSILRAPMSLGHAFRKLKTSVCRWQVRQYTLHLPEIHFFTASGFFLKIFDCLCVFVFVFVLFFFFFSFFFFFCESTYEKQEKNKTLKITTIYHVKRALSLCVI